MIATTGVRAGKQVEPGRGRRRICIRATAAKAELNQCIIDGFQDQFLFTVQLLDCETHISTIAEINDEHE